MREIRFRAWDTDSKTMLYEGWTGKPQFFVNMGVWQFTDREKLSLLHIMDKKANLLPMQYTGLKDKNGVEIYEGDILQRESSINRDYHGEWVRDEVIYKPGVFFVRHISSDNGKLPRGYTAGELLSSYFDYDGKLFAFGINYEPLCLGEVIGNIYENPELIDT